LEADISIGRKTGHFYFALTGAACLAAFCEHLISEPARTSVSSSRTFAPLLATEGLFILLLKTFQRELTCLMKLGIFILLFTNKRLGGGRMSGASRNRQLRSMAAFELAPGNAFSEAQA
jgi:hypothetical protein